MQKEAFLEENSIKMSKNAESESYFTDYTKILGDVFSGESKSESFLTRRLGKDE